ALVIGHDTTIAIAGMNGNLDLNVMMPVIAHALLEQVAVTTAAARVFARKCVVGIRANVERCRQYAELTGQLVTAIAPVVGYDRAAEVFKKAVARDVPIRQVLEDEKVLPKEEIARLLDLHQLARGGRVKAIVVRVNSPGGGVTASDDVYGEIVRFKSERKVPVVAALGDVAASGGYYVACAADRIVAHPTTVTGSIGVIMTSLNLEGLLAKVGVRNQTFK